MELFVCTLDDAPLPGRFKEFVAEGRVEVLVCNVDGKFFATSARCPHSGGAPLSEGTLEGIVLTCPWHDAQFRVTDGQRLSGPASENLPIFRNKVKDNKLFIEV